MSILHTSKPSAFASVDRFVLAYALVLLLSLLTGGCMSLAPRYQRPALPVPDAWPSDTASAAATTINERDWRAYFPDPSLQALIRTALLDNRDLRIAVQRVEEARATYGIRRADGSPTVSAGSQFARFRSPGGLLSNETIQGDVYQVGLSESNWEIDFWGRVRSLKGAALEQFLASDASRRSVAISLISNVADNYLLLRAFDERIDIAQQTIMSRKESVWFFQHRYDVGAISRLDLRQSEILLQQSQSLIAQLEQARAVQEHALALLVGAPSFLPPKALDDNSITEGLHAALPSTLLEQRPDIIAAEHQLRAAYANIGAARAAFFPQITLTSSFGTVSTGMSGLFAAGSGSWIFSPSVSFPIFDGARNRSNLALAKAHQAEAIAEYERSIQQAFRDVADALSARQWLADQVRAERNTLAAQSDRAYLVRMRYDNGATSFMEILDAQRDLLAAQQQLVQTRRALLSSRVALYAALGGGGIDVVQDTPRLVAPATEKQGQLP